MKSGRQMQNDMQMTTHGQYGDRKYNYKIADVGFSETERSYISAVYWDILSQFGMEIDFRLVKQVWLIEIALNGIEKLQI